MEWVSEWMSNCSFVPFEQFFSCIIVRTSYFSMRWWWWRHLFCTKLPPLGGFDSTFSLKQQSAVDMLFHFNVLYPEPINFCTYLSVAYTYLLFFSSGKIPSITAANHTSHYALYQYCQFSVVYTYFLFLSSGNSPSITAANPTAPAPSTTAFSSSTNLNIDNAIDSSLKYKTIR